MPNTNDKPLPLEQAPQHVQLAVDLIQLIEDADIDIGTAVDALEIALADFKQRQGSNKP